MPIYKVSASSPSAVVSGNEEPSLTTEPHRETNGLQGQRINGSVTVKGQEKTKMAEVSLDAGVSSRKENIVEKEVRIQREREAELAALHKDLDSRPSFQESSSKPETGEDTTPVRLENVPSVEKEKAQDSSTVNHNPANTSTTAGNGLVNWNGAKRILYELMEQKQREDELRRHWKDMGFELETDFQDVTENPSSKAAEDETDSRQAKAKDQLNGRKANLSVILPDRENPKVASKTDANQFGDSTPKSPASAIKYSPKVQPFEDVEAIQFEVCSPFLPQSESPIDKEIRLTREREEALRLARGIIQSFRGNFPNEEVEVTVVKPYPLSSSGDQQTSLDNTMKRFAEERLRTELEREKKRELDLLKEGKIKVLSDQRNPEAIQYVTVTSPEKQEIREYSRMKSDERKNPSDLTWERTSGGATASWPSVSFSPSNDSKETKKVLHAKPEHRIQEEIEENKKRETELREQRRSVTSENSLDSPDTGNRTQMDGRNGSGSPSNKTQMSPTDADDEWRNRRRERSRLALIDQWESGEILINVSP